MSNTNHFSCLENLETTDEEKISPLNPRQFIMNWADISEDDCLDHSFPPGGFAFTDQRKKSCESSDSPQFIQQPSSGCCATNREIPNNSHEIQKFRGCTENLCTESSLHHEKKLKDVDRELSKKKTIDISIAIKVYNKESRELITENIVRNFRIVTEQSFENMRKLVGKYKPNKFNGIFDYKEQKAKIEIANALLKTAYKTSKALCTFVYPIANITLANGKTILRNEITNNSKCEFTIGVIYYRFETDLKE